MSHFTHTALRATWLTVFVAACTDSTPTAGPLLSGRGSSGAVDAPQFRDVSGVEVPLPPWGRAWDTDDQALVNAVAAGDGYAVVAFKEPGSARVKETGFRAAVTVRTIETGVKLVEGLGGTVTGYMTNMGAVAVKLPPSVARVLRQHPLVDYVEPRQRLELAGFPARAVAFVAQGSQTRPWGVDMIHAPWVWGTTTTGSAENGGVKVLVIDAPYYRGHEDLPVIPLANCGNDGCSPGNNSHGTFVLGEITARSNSVGIVGVAPGVEDGNVYFWAGCNSFDGFCPSERVTQGIDQGVSWGVDVISMSIAGAYDLGVAEAARRAWYADVVTVAAAGNCWNNDSLCTIERYPAALIDVIGVSGVRDNGLFANTSPCRDPFGDIATSRYGWWVDLAGPFWSRSAVNNGGYEDEDQDWCGTSMATPFVSGTVALMRAKNPTIPNWQIQNILFSTAEDRGYSGWDIFYGYGIVRADNAVGTVPPLLQASIAGPSEVQPDYPCTWSAQVGGGQGPYTIQWSGVLSGSGYEVSGSLSAPGWLYLDVTDGAGNTDGDQLYITVSWSAPTCGF